MNNIFKTLSTGPISLSGNKTTGESKGHLKVETTDGAIDNVEVQGIFVTVIDIKINGKSAISFAGKITFDIMVLQNGNTKSMINENVKPGTYSSLTFVLDLSSDANGNSPGCYVLTRRGKQKLEMGSATTAEITAKNAFTVTANEISNIVVDFDLRKLIAYNNAASTGSKYSFVTGTEADASLRLVNKARTGTIKGKITELGTINSDMIIVYAYEKGSFDATTESKTACGTNVMFSNATSSSAVLTSGLKKTFSLFFIKEGNYELVFASYNKASATGETTFSSLIDVGLKINGSIVSSVNVKAATETSLTIELKSVLM